MRKTSKPSLADNTVMIVSDGTSRQIGSKEGGCVILMAGGADTGKTDSAIRPTIACSDASMVITDLNGKLYRECKESLEERGFRVICFDPANPERSARFNLFASLETANDVPYFTELLLKTAHDIDGSYVDNDDRILLDAVLYALAEEIPHFPKNSAGLSQLLRMMDPKEMEDLKNSRIGKLMEAHNTEYRTRTGRKSLAYEYIQKIEGHPISTLSGMLMEVMSLLSVLDTPDMRLLTSISDFAPEDICKEKTALFLEVSNIDIVRNLCSNLVFSLVRSGIARYADSQPGGRLSKPMILMLDDFGSTQKLYDIMRTLPGLRSRNISAMVAFQTISQMQSLYGNDWGTLLGVSDTVVYLGGNDPDTAAYFSRVFNVPAEILMNLPKCNGYVKNLGEKAFLAETKLFSTTSGTPVKTKAHNDMCAE